MRCLWFEAPLTDQRSSTVLASPPTSSVVLRRSFDVLGGPRQSSQVLAEMRVAEMLEEIRNRPITFYNTTA